MDHSTFMDLASEEEACFPIPDAYEPVMSIDGEPMFRHIQTGVVSHEHPVVEEALKLALETGLPIEWTEEHAISENGITETFYAHAPSGHSQWDHPLLRRCASAVLGSLGHSSLSIAINTPGR
jgi:hypothetical protein